MSFTIHSQLDEAIKQNAALGHLVPKVSRYAINATLEDIAGKRKKDVRSVNGGTEVGKYRKPGELQYQMRRRLQNPTPWTMNSFQISYARLNKRRMVGSILNHNKYMALIIHGGVSDGSIYKNQSSVITQPADGRLNKYGNIPRGYVKNRSQKPKYFVGAPKGQGGKGGLGLWERYGGKRNPRLRKLVSMKTSRPQRSILPFHDICRRTAHRNFADNFTNEFNRAVLRELQRSRLKTTRR